MREAGNTNEPDLCYAHEDRGIVFGFQERWV